MSQLVETWFKKIIPISVVTVLLLLTPFVSAQNDPADSGNGLRITPIRQEMTLAPGEAETYLIEISNVSNGTSTITVQVNDFESDDQTGEPRLIVDETDEPSPFSLKQFTDIPEPFTLDPGQGKEVSIEVAIPDNAAPGGYFGAIRFDASTPTGNDGTVALSASVASLLLVSVPGNALEQVSLEFIKGQRGDEIGNFFEYPPDAVAVRLNNTGNTIVKPYGRVVIKNMFGKEVYAYEFNGSQPRGNLLPQSSRTFSEPIQNIGKIGRYKIEANISYGEGGGNIISATGSFWVIPWRVMLAAIIVLAALAWLVSRGLKRYKKRIIEQSRKRNT